MKKIILIALFPISVFHIYAMDWIIPEPITYEWTVRAVSQGEIPKFTAKDVTIKRVIEGLGDDMTFPVRVETLGIDERKLEEKITIHEKQISWIEIVAIIADRIEADILISKGKVFLIPISSATDGVEPDGYTTRD